MPKQLRFPVYIAKTDQFKEKSLGLTPTLYQGSPATLGFAFFDADEELVDLSGYTDITLEVWADQESGSRLLQKVLAAEDFDLTCTAEDWAAGTKAQATFALTGSELNFTIASGTQATFYMVVGGTPTDAEAETLGYATLKLLKDRFGEGGDTVVSDPASYLSTAQSDARYARKQETKSGDFTAAIGVEYTLTASGTVTDPEDNYGAALADGDWYAVRIPKAGVTATTSSGAYSISGSRIVRSYNGTAWSDKVSLADDAERIKTWFASKPRRPLRNVMTTPPTVTLATATQISGGIIWAPNSTISVVNSGTLSTEFFTFHKCGFRGTPGAEVIAASHVTTSLTPTYTASSFGASFIHEGRYVEIIIQANTAKFNIKVDDEYIAATEYTTTSGSSRQYYMLDFGSRARRRIDLVGGNLAFYGVYTEATDTITRAETRGPRCIVFGDSFTQTSPSGYGQYLSDALGWDDVWSSGVGGTGYITAGSFIKFGDRIADITAFAPDIVLVFGSINDGGASVTSAATAFYSAIMAALPNVLLVTAVNQVGGVNRVSTGLITYKNQIKAATQAAGGIFLDLMELPRSPVETGGMQATTLSNSYSAGQSGATGIRTPVALLKNKTYELSGTERITVRVVTQVSGSLWNATFDGALQYAHTAGESVQQVSGSLWTGNGYGGATTGSGNSDYYVSSDGTHPTTTGHIAIGETLAALLSDAVMSR